MILSGNKDNDLINQQASANKQLISVLQKEIEGFDQFRELLLSEQNALMQGNTTALSELIDTKESSAQKLNQLAADRLKLIKAIGFSDTKDGIQQWVAQSPENISSLWTSLIKLARDANHVNEVNGKLINTRLQYTQQSLTALLAAVDQANLYGPDGQSNSVPKSGNIRGIIGKA